MALVEFGAGISNIKGSIGSWVFQNNRAGNIIRLKGSHTKNATAKQTEAQSIHLSLIQGFQVLSPGDKLAWSAFADTNPKINRFGDQKLLTGQNWYESINFQFLASGLPQLTTPPAALLPEAITGFNLTVDATKIELDSITPNNPTDTGIIILTTFPTTLTTKKLRGQFRSTARIVSGPFGTIDITSDWEAAHNLVWPPGGFADCINIGVMVQPFNNTTGLTGVGLVVVGGLDFVGSGVGSMEIGNTFIVT